MFRSTNKAAMLLMLVTMAGTVLGLPGFTNDFGPGDDSNTAAGASGEPRSGYHVRTCDPNQKWDAKITRTDGSEVQNQHIVKDTDAKQTTRSRLDVDPADGLSGVGMSPIHVLPWNVAKYNYSLNTTTNLYDIPTGDNYMTSDKSATPNETGYPSNQRSADYAWTFLSTMQQAGYCDSEDGVTLRTSGDDVGYNKFSEGKEHMLLYFGADWSPDCNEFTTHFAEYYKKLDHNKVEAVYFGTNIKEENYDAYRATMPFPAARYETYDTEHDLVFRLKNVLGVKSIPAVVVVDKEGNVVTRQGVRAIKGECIKGETYPLPTAAELFANDAILPGDGHASIDTEEQRKQLMEVADAAIEVMSEYNLRAQAKAANMSNYDTASVDDVRQSLCQKSDDVLKALPAADVEVAYAKLEQKENNPSNYHFKVGDYVRVVMAGGIRADVGSIGGSWDIIPSESGNKANVGRIVAVTEYNSATERAAANGVQAAGSVAGAVKIQFIDNMYANRWLLPEHFEYIEQITQQSAEATYGFPKEE